MLRYHLNVYLVVVCAADVLLVCVDLPRIIYPRNKSFVFHHQVARLLFRDQPILQTLALENALITVSVGTGLNYIQRNVVREWLSRPVFPDHRVYHAAEVYLSEAETDAAATATWSEPNVGFRRRRVAIPLGFAIGWEQLRRGFQSAFEASRQSGQPRKKKKKKQWHRTRSTGGDMEERKPLIDIQRSSTHETQELMTFSDVNSDVMFTAEQLSSTTCFVHGTR